MPLGQAETYTYFDDGSLKTKTDFNGKTTTFAYDNMRRLLSKTPDASFNQAVITFTYNALGQRETMTDASGTTTFAYDNRSRLQSKQTPFGTLTYTYDEAGNLKTTRSSNANGYSVDYSYDELNRLKTVKDNRLTGNQTTSYNYDDVGNLQNYSYPNGITTSYNYNSLNRLTAVWVSNATSNLASYEYTLGAAGNRTSVREFGGRFVTYSYDDNYRLITETIGGTPSGGIISYTYDAVGNRLSRTANVNNVQNQTFTYDANDRVTNNESYDANGNATTANTGNSYKYDFENRLLQRNPQFGGVPYKYDADGNLVSRTYSNVTTNYLVDTNNPTGYSQIVEEVVSGAVTKQFTYGHDLISQRIISGNILAFYQYDGHGSVRHLTDAAGVKKDTYVYDAFGMHIQISTFIQNDYLYAGERYDPQLEFYYLRARHLNHKTGRFLSMDSFEGSQSDPVTLHKYLYANADPANKIDPSGNVTLAQTLSVLPSFATLASMAVLSLAAVCSIRYNLSTAASGAGVDTSNISGPCIDKSSPRLNQMRVQLQQGNIHLDAEPVSAPASRGVTVIQMERALETMFHRSKHKIPRDLESEYLGAVARTSIGLRRYPPFGVTQGGNILRETFATYRVDTENLRGHNLRYIFN